MESTRRMDEDAPDAPSGKQEDFEWMEGLFRRHPSPFLELQNIPSLSYERSDAFVSHLRGTMKHLALVKGKHPPQLSPEEFRGQSKALSTQIFATHALLRQILDRHEDLICKRWSKKKKSQRASMLKEIWPTIPPQHRPDFQMFYTKWNFDRDENEEPFLWPEINLEDLSERRNLCLFINSRGRYTPSKFAYSDLDATQLGRKAWKIVPAVLNKQDVNLVMILDDVDAQKYGRVFFAKVVDANEANFRFTPGHGLLILQIQKAKLDFCLGCCQAILHDKGPIESLITGPTTEVEPDSSAYFSKNPNWSVEASRASERPYVVPGSHDFDSLLELVALRRDHVEDHIWSLREDPLYFANTLNAWDAHQQGRILDLNGKKAPSATTEKRWRFILERIIAGNYTDLEVWGLVHKKLAKLITLMKKQANLIAKRGELPHELLLTRSLLSQLLSLASSSFRVYISQLAPSSPPLRHLFIRKPSIKERNIFSIDPRGYSINTKNDIYDPLIFLLRECSQWRLTAFSELSVFVDELERLTQNPDQGNRLSELIAEILSSQSLVCQLQKEVDTLFPWSPMLLFEDREKIAFSDGITPNLKHLMTTLESFEGFSAAAALATPLSKFNYPPRKRNKESVDRNIKCEKFLDAVWEAVDRKYFQDRGDTIQNLFHSKFSPRVLQRTPEWIEPTPMPKPTFEATQYSTAQQFSGIQYGFEMEPTAKFEIAQPKLKVKKKGISQPQDPEPEEVKPAPEDPPKLSDTIEIKHRSLKVFSTLFFDPERTQQPGEISWKDFTFAMENAGFAVRHVYGSVWMFSPVKFGPAPNIEFHDPHSAKMEFSKARRIGRRLMRMYGWTIDTFVLEK